MQTSTTTPLRFFQGDYTTQAAYTVTDPGSIPQPAADGLRIAIVYSETTAANYFGTMSYAQLFMAAQSQAMASGTPFDVLSEADLTTANLASYDAIIFPSFRNVPANYADIATALNDAVFNHHVSLITSGEFMTNDATGGVLPDAYARMQSLLGVTRTGGDGGVSVDLTAAAGGNSITAGYGPGGEIRHYDNYFTSYFGTVGGGQSTVIAQQTVNGVVNNAVIGTTTGGHNVHFATDGFLADDNLLGKAIDWVTENAVPGPQLSLHMSRDTSIVASRTDVDQAMETADVGTTTAEANSGILHSLTDILAEWKTAYNFVGSYYVDIGLYPDDGQQTNWAVSLPYYQQILAMGNEIGSHSVSHPENTNFLFPDVVTQEYLDAIKAAFADPTKVPNNPLGNFTPYGLRDNADPAVISALAGLTVDQINAILVTARAAPDPTALDAVSKALLEATYSFQFQVSKQILESHGLTINGAAVPGMPETLDTANQIIQYYNYITGGATLVGAGYPGAIGYLSPNDTSKVYIAPNMSFDFTLVGFQDMTAAQAQAHWQAEFSALTQNSDMPIVVWPWHDYGPTSWITDPGTASPYTKEMFTSFIQTAYNAGAEFVTLDDLAQRIAAFDKTNFSYTVSGDIITATVAPQLTSNIGTFALDLDFLGTKQIQSVTGWYAYDNNSVFMDADVSRPRRPPGPRRRRPAAGTARPPRDRGHRRGAAATACRACGRGRSPRRR